MEGLLAGLYVAFDTTALALSLSILLMFVQFFVDRVETQLLSMVDTRVNEELVGRFETVGSSQRSAPGVDPADGSRGDPIEREVGTGTDADLATDDRRGAPAVVDDGHRLGRADS